MQIKVKLKPFILLTLLLFVTAMPSYASSNIQKIIIVSGQGHENAKKMLTQSKLRQMFQSQPIETVQVTSNLCSPELKASDNKHNLLLTLGVEALTSTLHCTKSAAIFASYIHHNVFHSLINRSSHSQRQVSALFLDPKIGSQYDLIVAVAKEMSIQPKLGILISPLTQRFIPVIKKQARKRHLQCQFINVHTQEDSIEAWKTLLKNTNIILEIPDPTIFNQHNARGMLMMANRHRIPVIGYSKSLVNIGALAALYCNKEQVTAEIVQLLQNVLSHKSAQFKPYYFASEYKLAFNFQTGYMLGGAITGTQQITQHLPWYAL